MAAMVAVVDKVSSKAPTPTLAAYVFTSDPTDASDFNSHIGGSFWNKTGERKLMLAILTDAADVIWKGPGMSPVSRREYWEALVWVNSQSDHFIYSYEVICGHLKIDSAYLRQGILANAAKGRKTKLKA